MLYIFTPPENGQEREADVFFVGAFDAHGHAGGEYLPVPIGMVEMGHRAYVNMTVAMAPREA